ncbi:response regulator transcription factor [Alkalicoccus daliensis]|uniref:Two component transcriptional regulator, LuxR family n=1 Tax=Alkalicoccus daliensis TaxID=745820 RepID=A0A1H0F7C0_9BACI|nr:response regulator transcription factor [Alkalicoccus daliensis]SDN90461.1 two component transcriptional regulator, LuxR family [Alkalicoccus daliensis]
MKILIVDDDRLICKSLRVLLQRESDMEVTGTALNGAEAINACRKELPDIVLMDIQMPIMNGIQATREMKLEWPGLHVMMLTTFKDDKNIRLAIQAGAAGYLIKSTDVSNMAQKLRALVTGSTVLDAEVLKELTSPSRGKELKLLTPRETDICTLVAEGFSNREIAEHLFISEGTVRNTLSVILDKLHLRDRTQLAIYYLKR